MHYRDLLIGYTGFVGSNLVNCCVDPYLVNSKNIKSIEGQKFSKVICAAPSGFKWLANKDPELDFEKIRIMFDSINLLECEKMILISSIDTLTYTKEPSYGYNRLKLEKMISSRFDDCLIIRLPALFGKNLKKNIIYDLINGDASFVNLNSRYQWLSIDRVADFIANNPRASGLKELYPEPLETSKMIKIFFPQLANLCKSGEKIDYSFKPEDGYLLSQDQVIEDLRGFLDDK